MNKTTDELRSQLNQITDLNKYLHENQQELKVPDALTYLLQLAEAKGISRAALVRGSQLERSFGYHLLEGTKNLTRDKALALAFGAQLTAEETQNFLKYAQLPRLYARNPRDNIILFCLNKGKSLLDTNLTLVELTQEPIN